MLAINLAIAAEASGEKACLIDLDPQGTVTNWFDTRTAESPAVVTHEKARNLTATLAALKAGCFTLVIIDTKRVMLYLPPKAKKKFREIAFHEDRKEHDVFMDALREYLEKRGHKGLL